MTIQQAFRQLLAQLYATYDEREAANIANMVIEHVTQQRKIDRIMYKDLPVTTEQQQQLENITHELLQHKPVQYVLQHAWFAGHRFFVNEHVLIPRPETEELVEWVIEDYKKRNDAAKPMHVLDVGTGSGCIPISIKLELDTTIVSAIDVSADALLVAKQNATKLHADVQFLLLNFLQQNERDQLGMYDVIISNPPYIRQSEEKQMHANVLQYEPDLALFVPDEDALVFYTAIAAFANKHLNKGGSIYLEINEQLGGLVADMFTNEGYNQVTIKKDMQGKERMVKVVK